MDHFKDLSSCNNYHQKFEDNITNNQNIIDSKYSSLFMQAKFLSQK